MTRVARLALLTIASLALICSSSNFSLEAWAIPGVLPAPQDQASGPVLSNADVVKMVKAHLSADVIVQQIQTSSCRFSLTTDSLIALKQAGVPDQVIAAMQAKGGGAVPATASGAGHGSGSASSAGIGGREYSIREFERLLPGILSKAATAHGLDAHNYDKEAAYIGQFLDKCALDGSNLKAQMPNPRDPTFDICQRRTYQHLHVGNFLDVSMAADNPHAAEGKKGLGRGDLMMDVGQPPNQQWWPGESYTLALKVFVDWGPPRGGGGSGSLGQFRFDDVLQGARIKGLPPKPAEAAAKSNEPTVAGSAPAVPATPYPAVDPPATARDFDQYPAYQLALLYIRRTPSVMDDPRILRSFVGFISCGDPHVASQMNNEFDSPQVSAYYRNNGASFLSNVPSRIKLRIPIKLGEFDFSNSSFPFSANSPPQAQTSLHPDRNQPPRQGVSFNHLDYTSGSTSNVQQCHGDTRWQMPQVGQSPTVYEVALDPVAIDRIAMDQATARSYIESHPDRSATIVVNIDLSDDAPKVYTSAGARFAAVVFPGHVTGITLYDSYPNGKVIQTLSSGSGVAAQGNAGAQPKSADAAPGASAGISSSPSAASSPDAPASTADAVLPVPVIRQGVRGKVLVDFLNKCAAGDSKGCEMVGYNLEKGWGTDKDPESAKAYYQKACSLGRKSDCNR